ncbi:hypothetical protein VNO77_02208 [Canavalia gladiata]|uniref:Uncharacterized protein n=1 Tax=Canavalia gladiata TaxID=3824 RepID=A0AAN9MTB9_CANGL
MMKLSTLKFRHIYLVIVVVVLFCPIVVTTISQSKNENYNAPAVMVFGDSIFDTGNNNYIGTFFRADFKPYGRDFIGGKPTGRFSDGKLPSDFFAEILGLKDTLPPYLDPNLKIEDLLTGVSFASAGSGYDPLTIRISLALSIKDQLNLFKEYIEKLKVAVGEEKTNSIIAQSIFMISMGNNDIGVTYFLTPFRRNKLDIEEYSNMLVNMSSNFLQELYQLGARRIGILSLPPLGCVPLHRTLGGGQGRNCVEAVNQAAMLYNSKLSSSITALRKSLKDAKLGYFETYNELNEIIQRYNRFGFTVEGSSCCGIVNLELGFLCSVTLQVCEDASRYVFWDAYHPTEKAYHILVTNIMKKNMNKLV